MSPEGGPTRDPAELARFKADLKAQRRGKYNRAKLGLPDAKGPDASSSAPLSPDELQKLEKALKALLGMTCINDEMLFADVIDIVSGQLLVSNDIKSLAERFYDAVVKPLKKREINTRLHCVNVIDGMSEGR